MATTVMWFRRDLRLADNAALAAAISAGGPVVPFFVWPDRDDATVGDVGRRWLHRSLASLDASLRERGTYLVSRCGRADSVLPSLAAECRAARVVAMRSYTPGGIAEQDAVRDALRSLGIELELSRGALLVEPDRLATGSGTPYRVFTPFHRTWSPLVGRETPLPAPARFEQPPLMPPSAGAVTPPPGGPDLGRWWRPGERGAHERLARFIADALDDYETDRDRPDLRGTSELSPHLSWGEISPRQVYSACVEADEAAAAPFVRQLAWREFAAHLLHHFPHTTEHAMRTEFDAMPWVTDPDGLAAWREGRTGYPLVDAGMRQLAHTGWMHNRVRLVAASLLTKHLLVDWREGERYFRDALADLDVASNVFNWQWVAGSGADASPYFRVFNPATQGDRFDPNGAYVRRWVPELERLDSRWLHRPWEAPVEALANAGVRLGATYPEPLIDHAVGRERALAAYATVKDATSRLR